MDRSKVFRKRYIWRLTYAFNGRERVKGRKGSGKIFEGRVCGYGVARRRWWDALGVGWNEIGFMVFHRKEDGEGLASGASLGRVGTGQRHAGAGGFG